jgi:hypothetical protein
VKFFSQLKVLKMKKNEDLEKDVQNAIKREPLLNAAETGVNIKGYSYLKKFIYLVSLAGIGLFFNACMAGYVATEPGYVAYSVPPRPSNVSIWIDGGWGWNNQSHMYVQKSGYWTNPRQGRTYVSGQWKSTPHGKSWSKGYWQSNGSQKQSKGNQKQSNGNQNRNHNR